MNLAEAGRKITPILRSGLLNKTPVLDEKFKVVEGYLKDYENKNPFGLNQFEILDKDIEKAILELLECFEKVQSQKGGIAVKTEITSKCPTCGARYIPNAPELYEYCEYCGRPLE